MDRVGLSKTQSSLEVLGKQMCFFLYSDFFSGLAQKVSVKDKLKIP